MSKLLIILLFALVQNLQSDGIEVYDISNWRNLILSINIFVLDVKAGEEFYIQLTGNFLLGCNWKLTNYDNITDALDDFGKKGESWKSESG